MRTLMITALLAALLPVAGAAHAADCGKLKIVDIIQLKSAYGGEREIIPLTINGEVKNFVFDTGGFFSQMTRRTAQAMNLPMRQGPFEMYDMVGNISRDQVTIHEVVIGHMRGTDVVFPVSPVPLSEDGIFTLDHLPPVDADLDFGTDTLRLFSPDHCDGQVVYWTSPASVGVVPITMDGNHIIVPVTLDGHVERALIDTGAPTSTLRIDDAQRLFGLTIGDFDTPEDGHLNEDKNLTTYSHTFKSLSFGDVAVSNPKLTLIPNAMGRNADRSQYVGDRTKSDRTEIKVDDMIIGMDVLRKLHIYIAFGERKMYVSQAAPPPATAGQ